MITSGYPPNELLFIYFPTEHTAADEDKEEEDIWLRNILQVKYYGYCNILQVQQNTYLLDYHYLII